MCMEDKRLGRLTGASETQTVLGASAVSIIGPSPDRITLRINPPTTDGAYVSTRANMVAGDGVFLTPHDHPIELTIEHYGSLVREGWFAIAAAATPKITVYEGLLDKD